jgi:pyruvate carboxylase
LLEPANLVAVRAEAEKKCGRRITEQELASYLMYPRIFTEFAAISRKFGPVSVLPTKVFFYGMEPGDEITVELEAGKTLVIQLQTMGETDDEGQVRVFFELNGQPRVIKVPNRSVAAKTQARRKADEGNEAHLAAPFPGTVSTVAVKTSQRVRAGDVLMTLEAMKMETALRAPRDGVVKEILVNPGNIIDAKDLLMVVEAA